MTRLSNILSNVSNPHHHAGLAESITDALHIWLLSRISSFRTIPDGFSIGRMAQHYRWTGHQRSVSICHICISCTACYCVFNHRYVAVNLIYLPRPMPVCSFMSRVCVCSASCSTGMHYSLFKGIFRFVILRYKPLIVVSAVVGCIIWSMLLWTKSLPALQVNYNLSRNRVQNNSKNGNGVEA